MPNWVHNEVTVRGDAKEIAKFRKFVENEKGEFDFEKIVPMPKIMNLVSGSCKGPAMALYIADVNCNTEKREAFIEKYGKKALGKLVDRYPLNLSYWDLQNMLNGEDHGVIYDCKTGPGGYEDYIDYGRAYVTCLMKYGSVDWYDWSIRNWGTKWNACDSEVIEQGDCMVKYVFGTAWSAPREIYKALAKKFKKLGIYVQYADEDLGRNCGEFFIESGYVSHSEPVGDPLKFACDVWGYDYEEILQEREEEEIA